MESDSWTANIPYHGSCPKCHHFHINHSFSFRIDPGTHTRLCCERCGHFMFGLGGTSIQSSLASVETVDSIKTDHSDPYLAPLTLGNLPEESKESVKTDHSDPCRPPLPPRNVPEESKESYPPAAKPESESSDIFQVTSLPRKKLATFNRFKGIANKISRPFRKRVSPTDQKVDNQTETQSFPTEDSEIRFARLRARRREKTLYKLRLLNDPKDGFEAGPSATTPEIYVPDYIYGQTFSGSTESIPSDHARNPGPFTDSQFFPKKRRGQRQNEHTPSNWREKSSINSIHSIDSCISVRTSISISYPSGDGRRKRIEHRTHSAVEARKTGLTKAKEDTKDLFSLIRRGKEGSPATESLYIIEDPGSLHKRSSSLSMLPQAKAAHSMPRRTSNLLDQNDDLAKEPGRRNSLLETALQRSYPSSPSDFDKAAEELMVRIWKPGSSLPGKAVEDANATHGTKTEASIAPPYDDSSPVRPQILNDDGLDRSSDFWPPSPILPLDRSFQASSQFDDSFEQSPAKSEDYPLAVKPEQGVDENLQDSRITRMNDKVFRLRWRCVSDLTV